MILILPKNKSVSLVEVDATLCHLFDWSFYLEYDGSLESLTYMLQRLFSIPSVALAGVNGKVFYIVELFKVPIGKKADRSIIIKNDVVMKMIHLIGILAQVLEFAVLFGRKSSNK